MKNIDKYNELIRIKNKNLDSLREFEETLKLKVENGGDEIKNTLNLDLAKVSNFVSLIERDCKNAFLINIKSDNDKVNTSGKYIMYNLGELNYTTHNVINVTEDVYLIERVSALVYRKDKEGNILIFHAPNKNSTINAIYNDNKKDENLLIDKVYEETYMDVDNFKSIGNKINNESVIVDNIGYSGSLDRVWLCEFKGYKKTYSIKDSDRNFFNLVYGNFKRLNDLDLEPRIRLAIETFVK